MTQAVRSMDDVWRLLTTLPLPSSKNAPPKVLCQWEFPDGSKLTFYSGAQPADPAMAGKT